MTSKWYATLCHPKMHPHTKFGIPTSKNIGDMHRTRSGTDGRTFYYYKNLVRGQGHSDPKMVWDTPPSQDASTHQIWNSYLKEYRRYAPDMKRDGRTVRLLYASQSTFGGIKKRQSCTPSDKTFWIRAWVLIGSSCNKIDLCVSRF